MTDFAVKFTGKDTIAGLAIPFGGPFAGKDLDGEDFGPDTELCLDWYEHEGRPLLYDHGLEDATKTVTVGKQVSHEVRDDGIWAESQLRRNADYRKAIDQLVEQGALSYSSGAMPHLVTVKSDGHITRWPWVELSLTPIPANPLAQVHAVKASQLIAHLNEAKTDIPTQLVAEALKALDGDAAPVSELLTARLDRVTGEVRGLTVHLREYSEMRTKKGRVLSAANRARLLALIDAWEPSLVDLKALLTETDPESGKALAMAVIRARQTLASLTA